MPQSPKVYEPNGFQYRVEFAAAVIARGTQTTRNFDTCFEMNDGDAVVSALVRRAKANPGGPLARNFSKYLTAESAEREYEKTKHLTTRGLVEYAAELRATAQREYETFWNAEYAAGRVSHPYQPRT